MKIEDAIREFKTPFYFFDIDVLKERINYIKDKIGSSLLCYAIKANPFVIEYIKDLVDRVEICSFGEFKICEDKGVDAKKMVISGVNKEEYYIDYIIDKYEDAIFTIESMKQYELIKKLAEKYNKRINILIRLTSGNQFGVNKEELFSIYRESCTNLNILGIEYFSGTQKKMISRIEKEFIKLNDIVNELEKEGYKVLEIEYGTGFPVSYFEGEEFDEESYLNEFKDLLKIIDNKKITLEIGRSLVASSGSYATKVVDKKENKVGSFAIVDGGMNHIVYYGSSMAMNLPITEVFPKRRKDDKIYNVCGSLCTVNDIMIKMYPYNLEIGDVILFKNAGAYSCMEGISLFLSRSLPAVIMKKDDSFIVAREQTETYKFNSEQRR